jgi:hypothetical protein
LSQGPHPTDQFRHQLSRRQFAGLDWVGAEDGQSPASKALPVGCNLTLAMLTDLRDLTR